MQHATQPSGYTSLFSVGYAQLVVGTANPGVVVNLTDIDPNLMSLLGYPANLQPTRDRLTVVNPPSPRVWVARCAQEGGAAEARAAGFALNACVTIRGLQASAPVAAPEPAKLVEESAGHLGVSATGPGWLVTDQPWYLGWSAMIDGVGQPVTTLDGALVGVQLPPGAHAIDLRYAVPDGFEVGLLLAALAGVVGIGLWFANPQLAARLRLPATHAVVQRNCRFTCRGHR